MSLPTEMKALVLNENTTLTLETRPVPKATPGSAVIRVLASLANPNLVRMLRGDNSHGFTQPRPSIVGGNAVGRVVEAGPDAVVLKEGQLVVVEAFVRARDDPDVQILWGFFDGMTPESKKLYSEGWRDGTYAEYTRAPLENIYAVDEKVLCGDPKDGGFGYTFDEVLMSVAHAVPYGGLRSIDVQAGETVIVTPATGLFSGVSISTALAMGCNVIAASRNAEGLAKVQKTFPKIKTVELKGDVQADTGAILAANGGKHADALLEISPPQASGSTLITSCMLAVKAYGRIVLMGGRHDQNVPIPWPMLLYRNLTIKGGFMYERADVRGMLRLLENGQLRVGKANGFEIKGKFSLEQWEECADAAVKYTGFGQGIILNP